MTIALKLKLENFNPDFDNKATVSASFCGSKVADITIDFYDEKTGEHRIIPDFDHGVHALPHYTQAAIIYHASMLVDSQFGETPISEANLTL